VGIAIAAVGLAWLAYSYVKAMLHAGQPKAPPQVVVSKPLVRELDSRLGFLGQFSAVDYVELRAQVAVRLGEYTSRMGTSSIKAISSSQLTRVLTRSAAQPTAQLETRQRGSSSPSVSFARV